MKLPELFYEISYEAHLGALSPQFIRYFNVVHFNPA